MEVWKDVAGYEGFYMVSNLGRVKRVEHTDYRGHTYKERILKPARAFNNGEYRHVHLSKDGVAKWHSVHRLVALAFCEKPEGCDIVNHLDCNPSNNAADNLEWTTYKGNMQHASKMGHMKGCPENLKKAQEANKIPVVAIKDGERTLFESAAEAGRKLGITRGHIAAACRKEYGYKTVGGYEWEYADPELQKNQKPNRVSMDPEKRWQEARERMIGNTLAKGISPSAETRAKLSLAGSKPVLQYDKEGNFIKRYKSAREAMEQLGISHVDDCARGDRKTAGGYVWKRERSEKNETNDF